MAISVKFYAERRKDKAGKLKETNVPILVSASFDRQRLKTTTGLKAEKLKQWSDRFQKFAANATNAMEKNKALENMKANIEGVYLTAINSDIVPTVQYLKSKLQEKKQETIAPDFFEVFDQFVYEEKTRNAWTIGTVKKFGVVKNKLHDFEAKQGKGYKIEFTGINEEFFNSYLQYLLDKGYLNSYVKKSLKFLKWFLNWCQKKGHKIPYDYTQFTYKGKTPTAGINTRPLTLDELITLYNKPIPNVRLSQVRDVFTFSCYTGLRYSDLKNLKKSDVSENKEYLRLVTQKTSEPLLIPLVKNAREILAKYENTLSKFALPVISMQRYNDYLKELGQFMEFTDEIVSVNFSGAERIEKSFKKWERLTTHVGRQTFITLSIFLGIPGEVVKDITGQSSDEMLKIYFKILDQQKRTEMKKFEDYETKSNSV
jgi:integrase